jgi:membrane protein
MRSAWRVISGTFNGFLADYVFRLGASLAFYTALSLAPLLILLLWAASWVWGPKAASNQLAGQMKHVIGPQAADVVQNILARANQSHNSALAATLGLAALILGATTMFAELQDALNIVFKVKPKPQQSAITEYLRSRVLSLLMIFGLALVLLLSVVISAALGVFLGGAANSIPGGAAAWRIADFVIWVVFYALIFAAVYKTLPDILIGWHDVFVGGAVTAILFAIGKEAIGYYLGRAGVGSSYGAAGSLVALLVWVYYSALILFLGAEFTHAYAEVRGRPVQPNLYADHVERFAG